MILYPRNYKLFLTACAIQILHTLVSYPLIGNHVIFVTLVSFYILVSHALCKWMDLLEKWRSNLFLLLITVYLISTFHKLNYDFLFNSEISCSKHLMGGILLNWMGIKPVLFDFLPVWIFSISTLIMESVIPLLLFIKRYRRLALILLIIFHSFLGPRYFDFSSMIFVLLFEIFYFKADFLEKYLLRKINLSLLIRVSLIFWSLYLSPIDSAFPVLHQLNFDIVQKGVVWSIVAFPLVIFLIKGLVKREYFSLNIKPSLVFFLGGSFLLIHGASPYLGNRTILSFNMYSNLVTSGKGNHVVVNTKKVRFFDELENLIRVEKTNLPYFRINLAMKERGWIPFLEVRRALSYKTSITEKYFITFEKQSGDKFIVEDVESEYAKNIGLVSLNYFDHYFFSYRYRRNPPQIAFCQW